MRNTEAVSSARTHRIQKTPLTIANAMRRKKYPETSVGERLQNTRKSREVTQVQLAEVAGTTQRAISYYETEAGFPPAPAIIDLARALQVTTDELLGVKPPQVQAASDDPGARRQWKRFQMVASLPERDQKAVIRLINSLVAATTARRAASEGERNGR